MKIGEHSAKLFARVRWHVSSLTAANCSVFLAAAYFQEHDEHTWLQGVRQIGPRPFPRAENVDERRRVDSNELAVEYRMYVRIVGTAVENNVQWRRVRSPLTADLKSAVSLQQDVFRPQNDRATGIGNAQRCYSTK